MKNKDIVIYNNFLPTVNIDGWYFLRKKRGEFMTNEQLVEEIKNGHSVTENMQLLYENNLPLIKRYIKKYTAYEDAEDLLQEAYFGLFEAVKHYETSENVLFMSYAKYWINQAVHRYIENCGSTVRIPSHRKQTIIRYKKTVQALEQELNREPTDKEIADIMRVPVEVIPEIKLQLKGVSSLDATLADDDSMSLCDTIQADYSLENDVTDKIYEEHAKNALWGIVERFTTDRENEIIKEYYAKNKSMPQIAKEKGMTFQNVRTIKDKGLRKLRYGRAKREILDKMEVVISGVYRSGKSNYKTHNFTSNVEYIAIRRAELEHELEKCKKIIENAFADRQRNLDGILQQNYNML